MSDFIPALEEAELEQLGLFLETEYQQRDALDFFGAHGFLTALTLGPVATPVDTMIEHIFDEAPQYENDAQKHQIHSLLKKLQTEIQAILDTGEPFFVPCELNFEADDEEPAPIELWTQGFVEASFVNEPSWYGEDDAEGNSTLNQKTAELMLPIMYASGLFMDEPEMQEIEQDPKLEASMLNSIPDIVSELYLHFHGEGA